MAEPEVTTTFNGFCCSLSLNRPAKLNALNLNMIRLLHTSMDEVDRRELSCLIMTGAGGKAFCAGGDVAAIRDEALNGGTLPQNFFFEEYALVFRLATLFARTGCCQVSIWDGITMGGGVGLSAHGPFRVVTEKTVFAKPEMAIGLFPDVGSTYMLSRLKSGQAVGRFIGLTGLQLKAWDCIRSGLASHFVPSEKLADLKQQLLTTFENSRLTGEEARAACEKLLKDASMGKTPDKTVALLTDENLEVIERCFNAPTLEDIVERLKAERGEFSSNILKQMERSCSPTSCKVTLRAISDFSDRSITLGYALQMEYRLSQRFTLRPQPFSDFYEGIRAVLVDKDRNQKWEPGWNNLNEITDERVKFFFTPLEPDHHRGELIPELTTTTTTHTNFDANISQQSRL